MKKSIKCVAVVNKEFDGRKPYIMTVYFDEKTAKEAVGISPHLMLVDVKLEWSLRVCPHCGK